MDGTGLKLCRELGMNAMMEASQMVQLRGIAVIIYIGNRSPLLPKYLLGLLVYALKLRKSLPQTHVG